MISIAERPRLLFTPVLQEKATQVSGYFPSAALWYDYYTFAPASSGQQTLNTPLDKVLSLHYNWVPNRRRAEQVRSTSTSREELSFLAKAQV